MITGDGTELGVVSEVQGDQFHVDVPRASDFWLDKRTVREAGDETTQLAYTEEQIEPYKLDEPSATAGSPIASEQLESFGSIDEQEARREDSKRGHA